MSQTCQFRTHAPQQIEPAVNSTASYAGICHAIATALRYVRRRLSVEESNTPLAAVL
jgi:hypothetical protein